MVEWLEHLLSEEGDFLMLWAWEGDLSIWYIWKVPENHTTGWSTSFEWSWVDNYLGAVDCYASTKSQVIVTESLSVLALPKLLIMSDNTLSPRN